VDTQKEQYAVQRGGNIMFGTRTLDLHWEDTGEYAAAIGLRTSNDKSMSIQLAIGVRVFLCDNLCFTGDLIALKRRHTKNLDLQKELAQGLDRYQAGVLSLNTGITSLKNTPIGERTAAKYVYDAFRKKIVPVRLFHPVTESWHKSIDHNLWTLHNCFTEHIKTMPPASAFRATTRLGRFFSLR
jgi:hypothetical protein